MNPAGSSENQKFAGVILVLFIYSSFCGAGDGTQVLLGKHLPLSHMPVLVISFLSESQGGTGHRECACVFMSFFFVCGTGA
jgi:hypothetical protein